MNHIWDVINSGGIYNFWDGGDVFDDFGYCTWNDSKFDDNVIDEYWDENESNEEAMNKTGMVMMMMTISTNLVFLV